MFQDKEFITVGNQKWHGAKANFIIKLIVINTEDKGASKAKEEVSKIPEASACTIKYLIAASFS